MNGPRRSGPPPTGPVDDNRTWRPSLGHLAVAVVIVAGGLAYGLMSSPPAVPVADAGANPPAVAVAASRAAPAAPAQAAATAAIAAPAAPARPNVAAAPTAQRIARARDPNGDQTPDITDFINEGERPTMAEVISRLQQAGVHSGLGAFSPPGTRPPLIGLAVPEDFVLPDGYVRHHQATDDGQRIEPILMFAPDRQFFDAQGRPIAIPKDRVVPPELAPPGLPIRRIVIPAPTEAGRPGR